MIGIWETMAVILVGILTIKCLIFIKVCAGGHKQGWVHRCTQVENPGEGVPDVFAKILRGVKAFRKNCLGGPPISGFIAFLLTSVLRFA
jgi:hypothetical protein